jgi:hypothetical protein
LQRFQAVLSPVAGSLNSITIFYDLLQLTGAYHDVLEPELSPD